MTARRVLGTALGFALAAGTLAAQTAPPTPPPTSQKPAGARKAAKAPLDFAGVWDIDLKDSKNVSTNMEKAVLNVRQNGDRIWIEPIEQPRPYLASEELVVDGQSYEKALGRGLKGSVQAQWGKDKKSLWIQSVTRGEDGAEVAFQRSVWELRDAGKQWTRRTWTVQKGETRESFLVFKKRAAKKP